MSDTQSGMAAGLACYVVGAVAFIAGLCLLCYALIDWRGMIP